jgi:Tfp pilus assembly protein PilE
MRLKNRFTIIELLVVIAIIIILAGLLLPGLSQVRARARMANCTSNIRQISTGMMMYRTDNRDAYPLWMSNLFPQYVPSTDVFICPEDAAEGRDGSISGVGHPEHAAADTTFPQAQIGKDERVQVFPKLTDHFYSVDDTSRNTYSNINGGSHRRNTAVPANSYMYEMNGEMWCWWYNGNTQMSNGKDATWYNVKVEQMEMGYGRDPDDYFKGGKSWDPLYFPAMRCFHHVDTIWRNSGLVLNMSYDTQFFTGRMHWEDGHD